MSHSAVDPVIHFTLAGQNYRLARSDVVARLEGIRPRRVGKYAVKIQGVWFPVNQAFGVGSGIPEALFNARTAHRHLGKLGLEVRGEVTARGAHGPDAARGSAQRPSTADDPVWHSEAMVQQKVVAALDMRGWRIVSQADTITRERGIDIVATCIGETVGIEVKGFPSRTYADPRRAGEVKPTRPSNQAVHWYSQAVLAAMRLRTRNPDYRSVIALPDFPRYRTLFEETRSSLDAAAIEVWWVAEAGAVEGL